MYLLLILCHGLTDAAVVGNRVGFLLKSRYQVGAVNYHIIVITVNVCGSADGNVHHPKLVA
jgi:hypothetical protein